jgi:hypothetical protein
MFATIMFRFFVHLPRVVTFGQTDRRCEADSFTTATFSLLAITPVKSTPLKSKAMFKNCDETVREPIF